MSYNCQSFVASGVRLPRSALYIKEQEPGCEHSNWRPFCPECGAPRYVGEEVLADGFDDEKMEWRGFDVWEFGRYVIVGSEISEPVRDGGYARVQMDVAKDVARMVEILRAIPGAQAGNWLIDASG